jgi:hypothetical protein
MGGTRSRCASAAARRLDLIESRGFDGFDGVFKTIPAGESKSVMDFFLRGLRKTA